MLAVVFVSIVVLIPTIIFADDAQPPDGVARHRLKRMNVGSSRQ
ncbi:MAG TPA: hypothetical protein VF306_21425 [Pirellulales bacterium]